MPSQRVPILDGISIRDVEIHSPFWSRQQDLSRTKTIPAVIEAQKSWNHWECLTWKEGHEPKPHQFWDSDIYKVVEAACYFLMKHPDDKTSAIIEQAVDMIREAQHADGYINSYYTVRGTSQRWTNLRDDHELYCIGHLLEAVVAYETLTNNGRLLEVAQKVCRHLDSVFGYEEGKKRGYPGHQEIEIGLMRLYELTQDPLYLKLARFFILERGNRDDKDEIYFDGEARARGADPYDFMGSEHKGWYHGPRDYGYQQADQPLVQATEAKGHSVRAVYYYTAATDLFRITGKQDREATGLGPALETIWRDMVDKKMYITGGLGSVQQWEGFGPAYLLNDLEDEGCYAETCATFALIHWCARMLRLNLKSEYADVMEVALYNGFLGAVNQDGDAFYYQNVLRTVSGKPKERSKWFGVACCPPNVARLLGNLGTLIYSYDVAQDIVAVHQYIGSELKVPETDIVVKQTSNMPWNGDVSFQISGTTKLAFRIPGWAKDWTCSSEGKIVDGYLHISVSGTTDIQMSFPMPARKVYANPHTSKDEVCIMRGPLVYCIEDVDNEGIDIDHLKLSDDTVKDGPTIVVSAQDNVSTVLVSGKQLVKQEWSSLYGAQPWDFEKVSKDIVAIPYFLRANREGNGAMRVWTPRCHDWCANGS